MTLFSKKKCIRREVSTQRYYFGHQSGMVGLEIPCETDPNGYFGPSFRVSAPGIEPMTLFFQKKVHLQEGLEPTLLFWA